MILLIKDAKANFVLGAEQFLLGADHIKFSPKEEYCILESDQAKFFAIPAEIASPRAQC